MATNAELNARVEALEVAIRKFTNVGSTTPAATAPIQRPPAQNIDQAKEYAYEGYANDGVQRRWLGTHPGNLDEARAFALLTPSGWSSPIVYGILVLSDFLSTNEEAAAATASGAGFSGKIDEWNRTVIENKDLSTERWWAEVIRQREAVAGTPGGGASGDRG